MGLPNRFLSQRDIIFLFGRDDYRLCRPCRYFFSWPWRQFSPRIYLTVRDLYLFNATFVGSICLRVYAIGLSNDIFLRLGQLPAAVTLPTIILVVCHWCATVFSDQPIFGGQWLKSRPICLRAHCIMGAPFFNAAIVCSTDSRVSSICHTHDDFCNHWQGQLPAAPTLPPICLWPCLFFCLSVNFLSSF